MHTWSIQTGISKSRDENVGENERDIVKKLAERLNSIAPQEIELIDENLSSLFSDGRGGNGGGFVGKEVAIVSGRQLGPKICG